MKDGAVSVRQRAAEALAKIGVPAAPALIEALSDPKARADKYVATSIVDLLEKIGTPEAKRAAEEFRKSQPELQK